MGRDRNTSALLVRADTGSWGHCREHPWQSCVTVGGMAVVTIQAGSCVVVFEKSSQRLKSASQQCPGQPHTAQRGRYRAPAFPGLCLPIAVGTAITTTQLEGSLPLHQLGFRAWVGTLGTQARGYRTGCTAGWRVGWNGAVLASAVEQHLAAPRRLSLAPGRSRGSLRREP